MAGMGCTEQYNRHWDVYNARLVERGTGLLDLSWVSRHKDEIHGMNKGKRGHPFAYGSTLIAAVCRLRASAGMPYRIMEGFLRPIFELIGINVPSYPTLWRRCSSLEVSAHVIKDTRDRIVAVDSTGIKVTVRGQWMREKWKVHKGWLKLHVLTDVNTNEILSFAVTDERSGDAGHMLTLVDTAMAAGHRIIKVLADGAYDTYENWNGMKERRIEFITNIRKNARRNSRGCMIRWRHVHERDMIGDKAWKEKYGYNMRWKAESAISDYKRMFGESVSSKRFGEMAREISRNIGCFNMMKRAAV
jgi:hypothetical protein